MNRRHFLTLLAGGAGIVAAAPVRRIWAVGATLERHTIMGMDLGFGGSQTVITQRWHADDMGEAMRREMHRTYPVDVRFGKTQAPWHREDLLYGFSPTDLTPEMAKYIVCDDVLDASPIVVRTEIADGYRS